MQRSSIVVTNRRDKTYCYNYTYTSHKSSAKLAHARHIWGLPFPTRRLDIPKSVLHHCKVYMSGFMVTPSTYKSGQSRKTISRRATENSACINTVRRCSKGFMGLINEQSNKTSEADEYFKLHWKSFGFWFLIFILLKCSYFVFLKPGRYHYTLAFVHFQLHKVRCTQNRIKPKMR